MILFRTLALSLALSVSAAAQSPAAAPQTPASAAMNVNFSGRWVGQLEYRDFQTDARTFLPTWLTMTPGADGSSITLDYIYDDGPTKTVRSRETLTLAGGTATVADEKTSESYALAGLEEFRKLGRGTLTLTGPGKENGKPVDVRITVTLRRNLFTWRKETRAAGATEFLFRDAYTFTRESPPAF